MPAAEGADIIVPAVSTEPIKGKYQQVILIIVCTQLHAGYKSNLVILAASK